MCCGSGRLKHRTLGLKLLAGLNRKQSRPGVGSPKLVLLLLCRCEELLLLLREILYL